MRRPAQTAALLIAALVAITQLVAVPVAQAAPAPLGMSNWVVSTAGFRTDAYRNYVRLGYLVFSPTANTAEHNFWTWNQQDNPLPERSGDVYYCGNWTPGQNPRNNCAIKTAPGFSGEPNGRFTGTYAFNQATGQVTVTWTRSTVNGSTSTVNLVETWSVSDAGNGLGRIALASDNYSLTSGIGYGSNAGFDSASKAPMSAIRGRGTFLLEGQSWNGNAITNWARGSSGGMDMSSWEICDDGSCLGDVQYNARCHPASCCATSRPDYQECVDKLADPNQNRRFYYLSGQFGGRRNTYEFWCECLSYTACYELNSHVRPLLQVIDNSGRFRGWVGTEVSPDRTAPRDPRGEYYASFALID